MTRGPPSAKGILSDDPSRALPQPPPDDQAAARPPRSPAALFLAFAGHAEAVWERVAGTNEWVVEAAVRPARGSWSTPVEVSSVAPGPRNPTVAVNATGDAIVVWQERTPSGAGIKASRGDTSGNWGAPETVSTGFDLKVVQVLTP